MDVTSWRDVLAQLVIWGLQRLGNPICRKFHRGTRSSHPPLWGFKPPCKSKKANESAGICGHPDGMWAFRVPWTWVSFLAASPGYAEAMAWLQSPGSPSQSFLELGYWKELVLFLAEICLGKSDGPFSMIQLENGKIAISKI